MTVNSIECFKALKKEQLKELTVAEKIAAANELHEWLTRKEDHEDRNV